MTFIITEACIGEKDGSCVEVCPVHCIYEGEDQYYIDADDCIDRNACVPGVPGRRDLCGLRNAPRARRVHPQEL